MNPQKPDFDNPAAVVQRQLDAFNARDVSALLAAYAGDAQLFEHPSKLLASGAAEFRQRYTARYKPEGQNDLRLLRDFVGNAFAGAHVFEVACGTGYWTEIIARSAASVLATDINEEVLAVARSKSMDPSKVAFRKEDAYRLPVFHQLKQAPFRETIAP